MTNQPADTRAANPQPLFRLIYSSHSRIAPDQTRSELGEIFNTARRKNKGLGVTGALVVTDDSFAQALEGDESVVRGLYESISHDARHERVTVLEAQSVDERTFGRWAMAKVAADGGADIRLLANARKGTIVPAGRDGRVSSEQEAVLSFMRDSISQGR